MLVFVERNGGTWNPPSQDELADTIEALADRSLSEPDFVDWTREHVT